MNYNLFGGSYGACSVSRRLFFASVTTTKIEPFMIVSGKPEIEVRQLILDACLRKFPLDSYTDHFVVIKMATAEQIAAIACQIDVRDFGYKALQTYDSRT
jgi:hypothetical protein